MGIIDIHTHAFPDALARRAVPALEEEGNIKAALDGTVAALLASMDAAGIEISVVSSISTRPEQFEPILKWSATIAEERIIPFPTVHPADPHAGAQVRRIHAEGFRGLKMHPYYQDFDMAEPRMRPIYEAAQECGLVLLCHTGYDLAFPHDRRGDPVRIMQILEDFPGLKLLTSHMGAWKLWDEVRRHMLGRPVYMDTSYAIDFMAPEQARELILGHPAQYVVFGTDSPWYDQARSVANLKALDLGEDLEDAILGRNARHLLGIG